MLLCTGEEAGKLRSQVGNAVAEKAKSLGLRAVAVVAYTEVRAVDQQRGRRAGRGRLATP